MKKTALALTTMILLSGCSSMEQQKETVDGVPLHIVNTSNVFDRYVSDINQDFLDAGLDCELGVPLVKADSYDVGMIMIKMYQSEIVTMNMAYGTTEKAIGTFDGHNKEAFDYVQKAQLSSKNKTNINESYQKIEVGNWTHSDINVQFAKESEDVFFDIKINNNKGEDFENQEGDKNTNYSSSRHVVNLLTVNTVARMESTTQLDKYTTDGVVVVYKICPNI